MIGIYISELEWLEHWYCSRCDGIWEHSKGVSIKSIDNPGWWVKIDIDKESIDSTKEVVLAVIGEPPSEKNSYIGGIEWMICQIKDGRFDGAGDAAKLSKIIKCFRELVEKQGSSAWPCKAPVPGLEN